ncbi:hypothetical protein IFM89_036766 [Coptis chinensis]|uniref:Uncharacterized protein n=1 Tax=Coptis chinensis TaxID=261450 RepID=A0A835HUI5_9MAGN|nr:hypothetical protein IFM89_036766 [Coptis chinensis]
MAKESGKGNRHLRTSGQAFKIGGGPRNFACKIEGITENQQRWVDELGFGGLLELKCKTLYRTLVLKLVDDVDVEKRTLKIGDRILNINAEEAGRILGIPSQGLSVPTNDRKRLRNGPILTLKEKLSSINDEQDFKMNFTMLALANMLGPTYKPEGDKELFKRLDYSNIKEYNWGQYVVDKLMEGIRKFRETRKTGRQEYNLKHSGSLIFLQCFFTSHFCIENPVKPADCTDELIKKVYARMNLKEATSLEEDSEVEDEGPKRLLEKEFDMEGNYVEEHALLDSDSLALQTVKSCQEGETLINIETSAVFQDGTLMLPHYTDIYDRIKKRYGRLESSQVVKSMKGVLFEALCEILKVAQAMERVKVGELLPDTLENWDSAVNLGELLKFNVGWLRESLDQLKAMYLRHQSISKETSELKLKSYQEAVGNARERLSKLRADVESAEKELDSLIQAEKEAHDLLKGGLYSLDIMDGVHSVKICIKLANRRSDTNGLHKHIREEDSIVSDLKFQRIGHGVGWLDYRYCAHCASGWRQF